MDNKTSIFELSIDEISRAHLLETARWGKFLSIIGFIGSCIIVLVGIIISLFGSTMMSELGGGMGALGGLLGLFYILFGALYFYPSLKLNQFSRQIPVALNGNDQQELTIALNNLRIIFKFWGIVTIVLLALYALAFILGGLGVAFGS